MVRREAELGGRTLEEVRFEDDEQNEYDRHPAEQERNDDLAEFSGRKLRAPSPGFLNFVADDEAANRKGDKWKEQEHVSHTTAPICRTGPSENPRLGIFENGWP